MNGRVIIEIKNGAVYDVDYPDGITVEIRDYDAPYVEEIYG